MVLVALVVAAEVMVVLWAGTVGSPLEALVVMDLASSDYPEALVARAAAERCLDTLVRQSHPPDIASRTCVVRRRSDHVPSRGFERP